VAKIIAFFSAWLLAWLPIAIPLARRLHWQPFTPLAIAQKLPLVLSLYAIVPFLLGATIVLEQVSPSVYGIAWNSSVLVSLVTGLSLAIAGVALLFGLEVALGWVEWRSPDLTTVASIATNWVLPLGLGLVIGAIEEAVFRGFLLTQLQQEVSWWIAAVISSLVFALLHLVWDSKALPQLPGLGLMGLVLVLARWLDGGSLGVPWGLHAGWIWAMASLDAAGAISYRDRAPVWLTGFAGQPLAGGLGLLLLLLTGGVVWSIRGG